MGIATRIDGNTVVISIAGRFDFSVQRDFRQAYESAASSRNFVIDFSAADYMDSSALGMLLLLRDFAGGDSANVELKNYGVEIKNILEISNFGKLFKIS
ncbi:MAG: STAS domain-containing protein [Piscirickettsiaceae bacterium]|nr:STAS domain-containing protein [Piscirickettsiaceae bacterium]